jgi:FdhD protein
MLQIEVNGWPAASFLCSPTGLQELALGWAFSQGLIEELGDVQRITPYPDRISLMIAKRRVTRAATGVGYHKLTLLDATMGTEPATNGASASDGVAFTRNHLDRVIDYLYPRLHIDDPADHQWYAALTDAHELCVIAADLDPIHIVDKLIGWTIAKQVDRTQLMLCLSSKITAEIAARVCHARFQVVITNSVPSEDAIDVADANRLTLVGRARHKTPTIYTHQWRIEGLKS